MKMRIILALLLILCAVPGVCEETNSGTWTYSTGLKILSVSNPAETSGKISWKIERKGRDFIVNINDFFYRDGAFEDPSLSLPSEGKVTLTVCTKKQKLFQTKSEYNLQLKIKISGDRLHKGETVYFYNGDYGEVVGQQTIK
jgi:hypothetical protein